MAWQAERAWKQERRARGTMGEAGLPSCLVSNVNAGPESLSSSAREVNTAKRAGRSSAGSHYLRQLAVIPSERSEIRTKRFATLWRVQRRHGVLQLLSHVMGSSQRDRPPADLPERSEARWGQVGADCGLQPSTSRHGGESLERQASKGSRPRGIGNPQFSR